MTPGNWIALAALIITALGAIIAAVMAWTKCDTIVKRIDASLAIDIKPIINATRDSVRDIDKRLAIVESIMNRPVADAFAPANSPRKLNDKGYAILDASGLREIIAKEKEYLLGLVRIEDPKNAYDAEVVILHIMSEFLDKKPEYAGKLKDWAFNSGTDVQTALMVGGFHLRDIIFPELKFDLGDTDNKPPQTPTKL